MKKQHIARVIGWIGASLLGVIATGCSGAEPGTNEGAQVGSTAQAITAAYPAARTNLFDACRLSVSGTELVLNVAGLDKLGAGKAVQADINLADSTSFKTIANSGLDNTSTTSIAVARQNHRLITDPNDPASCLVLGGEDAASPPAAISGTNDKAYRITVSKPSTQYHIAVSSITGYTPRAKAQVAACGSNSVIAYGGEDGGTVKSTLEVLTSGSSAFASVTLTGTPHTRVGGGLALVNDGTGQNFVGIAGDGSSGLATHIDVFKFNADCTTVTVTDIGTMNTARKNTVAFETAYDAVHKLSTIKVPGGITSSPATVDTVDTVVVDFSAATPTLSSKATSGSVLQGVTSDMRLAIKPSTNDAYIVGGYSGSAVVAYVSKFAYGTGTISSPGNLSTAREGHAVTFLPTANKIQVMAGDDATNTLTSDEELTP